MLNSQTFLDNLSQIDTMMKENRLPLQLQEIRTLIQYAGSQFNIETGRAFQKYKETQVLSIALYYDSWWPFIQHATATKEGKTHTVTLNVPEGMKIIDKDQNEIVLHSLKVVIPVGAFKKAQEIDDQNIVQPQPQPTVVDFSNVFGSFEETPDDFTIFEGNNFEGANDIF